MVFYRQNNDPALLKIPARDDIAAAYLAGNFCRADEEICHSSNKPQDFVFQVKILSIEVIHVMLERQEGNEESEATRQRLPGDKTPESGNLSFK